MRLRMQDGVCKPTLRVGTTTGTDSPGAGFQRDMTTDDRQHRYADHEVDLMDRIPVPRLNPWLALGLLILSGFAYLWLWGGLLRG